MERGVRVCAVEAEREARAEGWSQGDVTAGLGVPERTLRRWRLLDSSGDLGATRRGRPARRSSHEARQGLVVAIVQHGPWVGVKTLRKEFPGMPRSEIRDVLERMRAAYVREHEELVGRLTWLEVGWVWAMDHAEPPRPIDGVDRAAFALRDLSSGMQLLWEGQRGPRARPTARALEEAFRKHGAPLVLKCDNGSAFRSRRVRRVCRRWGVLLLWSPPRTPRYNGAIEATIRRLKERTEHQAMLEGRPGVWLREDLEAAMRQMNERPYGGSGDPRARRERFAQRRAVDDGVRAALRRQLARELWAARAAARQEPADGRRRASKAGRRRDAIGRALVALGILTIRMGRVRPRFLWKKAA